MKIRLRLVYADGDSAATLLRPKRWSYAFYALLYPFCIKSEVNWFTFSWLPTIDALKSLYFSWPLWITDYNVGWSSGPKGPGSFHDYPQTDGYNVDTMAIIIRAMSMEDGSSFFNLFRMELLRIGPRIQKSDANFRRELEQGLELARTPRA